MTSVLVKRPVAYRIPRLDAATAGTTIYSSEWRYFADEEQAYKEAEQLGVDYQALFVRDGTAIVLERDEVEAQAIERCAKLLEMMAEEQDATNQKYPDHAKAYATWVDRVYHYRASAQSIRALLLSRPHGEAP
jgi:hypothetical protein